MRHVTSLPTSWEAVDLRGPCLSHPAFFRSFPLATRRATTVHMRNLLFSTVFDQLCVDVSRMFPESLLRPDSSREGISDWTNLQPNRWLQCLTGPQIPNVDAVRHTVRLFPNLVRCTFMCGSYNYVSDNELQMLLDGLKHLRQLECPEVWMTFPITPPPPTITSATTILQDCTSTGSNNDIHLPPTLETLLLSRSGQTSNRNVKMRDIVGATTVPSRMRIFRVEVFHSLMYSWKLERTLAWMPALRELEVDITLCLDPLSACTILTWPGIERLKFHMNLFKNVRLWPSELSAQPTLERLDFDVASDTEANTLTGMRRLLLSCTRLREIRITHWSSVLTDCLLTAISEYKPNTLRYVQLPGFLDKQDDEECGAIAAPGSRPLSSEIKGVPASIWFNGPYPQEPLIFLIVPCDDSTTSHLLVPRTINPVRVDTTVAVEIHHRALGSLLKNGILVTFSNVRNSTCQELWHDRDAPSLVRESKKCCWDGGSEERERVKYCAVACVYDCICRAEQRKWRKNMRHCAMTFLREATIGTTVKEKKNSLV